MLKFPEPPKSKVIKVVRVPNIDFSLSAALEMT